MTDQIETGAEACAGELAECQSQKDRIRAEYQRFYDFVGESDPALVDAWHFTENAAAARARK